MSEKPITFRSAMVRAIREGRKTQTRLIMEPQPVIDAAIGKPPYNVGDVLWVRETFATDVPGCPNGISYRADHIDPRGDGPANPMKWRSPIHMPRWASRIDLRVTQVRAERLQDISFQDAIAEGVDRWGDYWRLNATSHPHISPEDAYAELWQSIHGGDSWAANPVVWVIDFEPLMKAGEQ